MAIRSDSGTFLTDQTHKLQQPLSSSEIMMVLFKGGQSLLLSLLVLFILYVDASQTDRVYSSYLFILAYSNSLELLQWRLQTGPHSVQTLT